MAAVVVDTDVISFQFKRDSRARLYRPHLIGQIGVLSFMTLAELEDWAKQYRWGKDRRDRLDQHLGQFVFHFADRVLCRQWAEVRDRARRKGRTINVADA